MSRAQPGGPRPTTTPAPQNDLGVWHSATSLHRTLSSVTLSSPADPLLQTRQPATCVEHQLALCGRKAGVG